MISPEVFKKIVENQSTINSRYSDIRRLHSDINRGHFSIMFTAKDSESKKNKDVVLKFFNFSEGLERFERFKREVDILSKFNGKPNIVQLLCNNMQKFRYTLKDPITEEDIAFDFDFFVLPKALFDLKSYIDQHKYDYLQNLLYFGKMCKSIQRIHTQNVFHRDIKPENFLVFPRNEVCLTDFGCAKCITKDTEITPAPYNIPVGDRRYTAPELLFGLDNIKKCLRSSDIFALGGVLFELFTKQVMTDNIYDQSFIRSLFTIKEYVRSENRFEYYKKLASEIAAQYSLPDMYNFNPKIPKCLKSPLNNLYYNMAQLDFKKRLFDFELIFRRINICITVLRNEKAYLKWLEIKKKKKQSR